MKKIIVVRHGKKVPMASLPEGSDLSDPPLTEAAKKDMAALCEKLLAKHGKPSLIASSTKTRAIQTGTPMEQACPEAKVVRLQNLGQPDNGEPDASVPGGIRFAGERSTEAQWWAWWNESLNTVTKGDDETIALFTHGPFMAIAVWQSQNPGAPKPADGILWDLAMGPPQSAVFELGENGKLTRIE